MPHGTKIATCCYCGTRAALVLKGDTRHELSCSACGAPLHEMKMLRAEVANASVPNGKTVSHRHAPKQKKAAVTAVPIWARDIGSSGKKKKKKRKTLAKRLFEEAFDVLEDIFD